MAENVKLAHLQKCLAVKFASTAAASRVEILSRNDSPGCQEGENYDFVITSHAILAKINEEEKRCNFISKCLLFDAEFVKWLLNDFKVELYMHETVFPALAKIRQNHGLNPLQIPKCYFTSIEGQVIIMENVKELGYSNRKAKIDPLTENEVKAAFSSLASIHATSHKLLQSYDGQNKAEIAKNLKSLGWILAHPEFSDLIDTFFKGAFMLAGVTFNPDLIPDLKSIDAKLNQHFEVIILDDFWYNNVMYQGDSKALILDFQHCKVGNLAHDLAHFMTTSVHSSMRKDEKLILLHYYEALKTECEVFGFDLDQAYNFSQLLKDYKAVFPLGFLYGIMQAHTDHIGKEDGVDWNQYFCRITPDLQEILLQTMRSKSKVDFNYQQRVADLVHDFLLEVA